MSTANGSQRRRGVRASRAKLVHALSEAGFKTQAALAEHIADIEGLDTAPKDAVNRVFREMPVDPTTIERLARALGVEAHTLYKTADEEELALADDSAPSRRKPVASLAYIGAAVVALIIVIAIQISFRVDRQAAPDESHVDAASQPAALDLGTPTLAVIPFIDDADGAFARALRRELEKHFNVARPTSETLTRSRDPVEVATRLRTDVVIDGDVRKVGRLSAVRVYLYRGGVRQQVWADSVPSVALADSRARIAAETALAARKAIGMPVP